MKANEFVKKFGSKSAKYWIDHFNNVNTLPDEFINTEFLGDLKRLVESHELVESFGGLEMAKESLKNLPSEYQSYTMTRDDTGATTQSFKLNQAIFDVESCQ